MNYHKLDGDLFKLNPKEWELELNETLCEWKDEEEKKSLGLSSIFINRIETFSRLS